MHYYWYPRFEVVLVSSTLLDLGAKGYVELQELDAARRFVVTIADLEHTTEMGVLARAAR